MQRVSSIHGHDSGRLTQTNTRHRACLNTTQQLTHTLLRRPLLSPTCFSLPISSVQTLRASVIPASCPLPAKHPNLTLLCSSAAAAARSLTEPLRPRTRAAAPTPTAKQMDTSQAVGRATASLVHCTPATSPPAAGAGSETIAARRLPRGIPRARSATRPRHRRRASVSAPDRAPERPLPVDIVATGREVVRRGLLRHIAHVKSVASQPSCW